MTATVRILLVEDNDVFRSALELLLGLQEGFEVVGAVGDGRRAAPASRELQPDVVVMDYRLPGMDGVETARALWADERTRGIPIVLLTAKVQVLEFWHEVPGVVSALIKPFNPFGLVAEIDRILGLTAGS